MRTELILPNLPMLFATLFIAILFIQSGLDKVFNFSGNKVWLTGHFGKTFLAGMVPMMLATLTVMEVAAGVLAAVGLVYFLLAGSAFLIFLMSIIGALTFIALFFGQRLAQDYPGAAVLVPYFILDLIVMTLAYQATYAR